MINTTLGLAKHENQRQLLLTLFLLAFLLGLEGLGLWLTGEATLRQITRFSAIVAGMLLLTGLVTALLRPGPDTRLAGVLAILLASLLVVPFDLSSLPVPPQGAFLDELSLHALLRLFNGVMAIPVGLHLVARFPKRAPWRATPSDRSLFFAYITTAILLPLPLLPAKGSARLALGICGLIWLLTLWGWIHWLLIQGGWGEESRQQPIGRRQQTLDNESGNSQFTNRNASRAAQQSRLLLFGFVIAEVPLLLRLFFFGLGWGDVLPYSMALVAQIAVPMSVTYGVLRHDLFEIDATVRRALAYTALIATLLTVYFGLTLFVTEVLARSLPQIRGVATLAVLLAAAVIFRPLYGSLQRFVDRLFYPERLRFEDEIAGARQALQQIQGRASVIRLLTADLPQRLDLVWASLVLAPDQDVPGGQRTPVWNERLLVGERVLGRYWVGARRSGLLFDGHELSLLRGVVEQAALALAYAETLEDLSQLNRSLEAQVAARTAQVVDQQRTLAVAEDRRRLARDLHDSVNQTLFSISLGVRALQKLVTRNPQAAIDGLTDQERAAQQALAEMRALLTQLRAPLLTAQSDFVESLRQQAEASRTLGISVTLSTPDHLDLPVHVANELLYVAKEALHNAAKYSGVHEICCTLAHQPNGISLIVEDAGIGFALDQIRLVPGHGLGLGNMAERMAELGGTLTVHSLPGSGTRIEAWLPVHRS